MIIDKKYWNDRYRSNQTGWDIGHISQPIKEYLDQLTNKNIAILIPGCGNAYEAEYLLKSGFKNITLVDFSELAVENLLQRFKEPAKENKIKIVLSDFFEMNSHFDLIIEQTFFCALDPSLRKKYATKMHTLLNHNGKVAGLLFSFPLTYEGPPFGGSIEEYQKYFREFFEIQTMDICYNSIQPRKDRELFFILKKKTKIEK